MRADAFLTPNRRQRPDRPTGSSSARTASPTRSCGCTRCRSCRACGRWAPVPHWTIRPATSSGSSTTTACSSCTARRSGTPWSAAHAPTSTRSPAAAPRAGRPRGVERAAPRHRGLGAELVTEHGRDHDAIVIATHADQALDLLADASREEKDVLGAFRYSRSETVLHTDARLLPPHRRPGRRGTTSRRRHATALTRRS